LSNAEQKVAAMRLKQWLMHYETFSVCHGVRMQLEYVFLFLMLHHMVSIQMGTVSQEDALLVSIQ
jgi:hypothetical protein